MIHAEERHKGKGEIKMCEIYDQIEGQGIKKGIQKGIQQERVNTERERKRAEEEQRRADAAEKELERIKKILSEKNIII